MRALHGVNALLGAGNALQIASHLASVRAYTSVHCLRYLSAARCFQ